MAEFKVESNAPAWLQAMRDKHKDVADAAVAALHDVSSDAVQEGRQDIASAGHFGSKWQRGLNYVLNNDGLQSKSIIFHKYGFAGVFEYGATIQGKPLLWIPTTPGGPAPKKSGKKLVSVNVAGKPPMLFDKSDRNRHKKPLYIGVPRIRIPKLFHITEIVKKHVAKIATLFIKHFKG